MLEDLVFNPDGEAEELGEVFTRQWVVELILDLVGYTSDKDLASLVAVEPACGQGAFLGPMLDRLIASCAAHQRSVTSAVDAIRAFDLNPSNVEGARKILATQLADHGVDEGVATALAGGWVEQGDFLLDPIAPPAAAFVVGNPPYVRLEDVSSGRSEAYRRACPTMRGRSDIYVGFIERGLRLLQANGVLGYIVADRWMHNQYGARLRRLIGSEYSVDTVIEMHDVDAFEEAVSAYPAVTIIRRAAQGSAVLASANARFGESEARSLAAWAVDGRSRSVARRSYRAARMSEWFEGEGLWPTGDPASIALVRDLERRFPPLQDKATGTRVGIGVASGADSVYLTRDRPAVEEDRLLPLVMAGDLRTGQVEWSGTHMVNPWEDGKLVDLQRFPRLREYLENNAGVLRARHVSRQRPATWFRTIDRVDPTLQGRAKLLLPELKSQIHPVLESGLLYPHHNLYFTVSDGWDLEVLGGILLSDVANLFVGTYCVKMRGGSYRFQAQYLRQIRVPSIDGVGRSERAALRKAFRERDVEAATEVSLRLYGVRQLPASAVTA